MSRLVRYISNGLAVLSLILFVVTVAVWVRSYFANDWIGRVHYAPGIENEDHHLWLISNCGILELSGGGDPIQNFSHVRWERRHFLIDKRPLYGMDGPSYLREIGISWQNPTTQITGEISWTVNVRLGLLALVTAIATVFFFIPWQRVFTHPKAGMCFHCGYDLRATPDRCPECGQVPNKAKA
jgi:hypothetical protein